MKWLSTVRHADGGRLVVERMELDESGFPQPTGELEELEADSLVLALGQEADLSLLERVAGVELDDGVVHVGADLMTGRPGVFAGGDIVPAERTVTMAIGHGKAAARSIDAWLRGDRVEPRAPRRGRRLRRAEPVVLQRRAAQRAPAARARPAPVDVRRGHRRPRRIDRAVRGTPLPVVRQLLRLRQLLRRLPRQRRHQARPRRPVRVRRSTSTTARAAACAPPNARAARSRWNPRRSDHARATQGARRRRRRRGARGAARAARARRAPASSSSCSPRAPLPQPAGLRRGAVRPRRPRPGRVRGRRAPAAAPSCTPARSPASPRRPRRRHRRREASCRTTRSIVAVGARAADALPGALPFAGPQDVPALTAVLDAAERGDVRAIAFASPRASRGRCRSTSSRS